jgi:hypothetical protein
MIGDRPIPLFKTDVIHDRDRSQVKRKRDVLSRFSGKRSALRSSGNLVSKDLNFFFS